MSEPEAGRPRSRKLDVLRILAVLLLAGFAAAWLREAGFLELLDPDTLRTRVDSLGWRGVLLYLAAWVVLVVVMSQSFLPTIAGGILFGWLLGGVLAVAGATLGCSAQFLIARYLFRGPAESLVFRRYPRVRDTLEERGLGLLLLLRLVWAPPWAVNIASGVTRLPYRTFALAFPAMLPQAWLMCLASDSLYVYGWRAIPPGRWAGMSSILLGSIAVYMYSVRRWPQLRVRLRQKVDEPASLG